MSKSSYVFVAGGTGGHLYPALACAEALQERDIHVDLITDERGLRFLNADIFKHVTVRHITRKNIFFYALTLLSSFLISLLCFIRHRPQAVVGFGGYMTAPPVFAAQILGIQTYLQEQNATIGKANRFLMHRARHIYLAFDKQDNPANGHVVGAIVRSFITHLDGMPYPPAAQKFFHILCVGGSQGAKILSTLVPAACARLPEDLRQKIHITQQCRAEFINGAKSIFKKARIKAVVSDFFQDMPSLYKNASFVIARSGASTLAELALTGRPALLIPYARAIEGDQYYNAKELKKKEACWMMLEKDLTEDSLAEFLKHLIENPDMLLEKSKNIRHFARPRAAHDMVEHFLAS